MKRLILPLLFSCLTLVTASADIPSLVSGKLVHLVDGSLKPVDDSTLKGVKYYALYYSAGWCPPCHVFTPHLVEFYKSFKASHPNFELIFVSEDQDAAGMLDYMKDTSMPWLAISFDKLKHDGAANDSFKGTGIESFANQAIPDLVLVDSTGKVLADTFAGNDYVEPPTVLENIKKIVQ